MKTIFISIVFYSVLLTLAVFSLQVLPHIPERYLPVFELLPFILMLFSVFLGLKFNRSQLVFSAILFTLIYGYCLWYEEHDLQKLYLILNALTIILSVNMILIAFYSERGIFNLIGVSRLTATIFLRPSAQ